MGVLDALIATEDKVNKSTNDVNKHISKWASNAASKNATFKSLVDVMNGKDGITRVFNTIEEFTNSNGYQKKLAKLKTKKDRKELVKQLNENVKEEFAKEDLWKIKLIKMQKFEHDNEHYETYAEFKQLVLEHGNDVEQVVNFFNKLANDKDKQQVYRLIEYCVLYNAARINIDRPRKSKKEFVGFAESLKKIIEQKFGEETYNNLVEICNYNKKEFSELTENKPCYSGLISFSELTEKLNKIRTAYGL